MKLTGFLAVALLAMVAATSARAWEENARPSIVRITAYPSCPALAAGCEEEASSKVGTGFVVMLPGEDAPFILTAYHVIAGSTRFSYSLTEWSGGVVVDDPMVFGVNPAYDIALLEIPTNIADRLTPLRFAEYHPEKDQDVIALGHRERLISIARDTGTAANPEGFSFGTIIKSRMARELWDRIQVPSPQLPIVGLDEVLAPGDSGAPIFDANGLVLGMGHGGIPSGGSGFSWMLSALTLNEAFAKLEEFDYDSSLSAFQEFEYSAQLFQTGEPIKQTPIAPFPKVRFVMAFGASSQLFEPYLDRLREIDKRNGVDWHMGASVGPFGSTRIFADQPTFPAAGTVPFECDDTDIDLCALTTVGEAALISALDGAKLTVSCYREETFVRLVRGTDKFVQEDLTIQLALGPFVRNAASQRFSVAYDGPYGYVVYVESNGFVDLQPGADEFRLHPDTTTLEQLRGGGCLLNLRGHFDTEADEALRFETRRRGMCFHMILAENTHTPVSMIAHMPHPDFPQDATLWGLLPVLEQFGTPDDSFCI